MWLRRLVPIASQVVGRVRRGGCGRAAPIAWCSRPCPSGRSDVVRSETAVGRVALEGIRRGPNRPGVPQVEHRELLEARPPGIRALAMLADPLAERVAGKVCPTLQAASLLGSKVDLVLARDGLQSGVCRHGSAASIVDAGTRPDIMPFCPASVDTKTKSLKFLAMITLQGMNLWCLPDIFRHTSVNSQYFRSFNVRQRTRNGGESVDAGACVSRPADLDHAGRLLH